MDVHHILPIRQELNSRIDPDCLNFIDSFFCMSEKKLEVAPEVEILSQEKFRFQL